MAIFSFFALVRRSRPVHPPLHSSLSGIFCTLWLVSNLPTDFGKHLLDSCRRYSFATFQNVRVTASHCLYGGRLFGAVTYGNRRSRDVAQEAIVLLAVYPRRPMSVLAVF